MKRHDNSEALDAFIAKKTEIDGMLTRLQALSDDHFDAHPDKINWAHVGALAHYSDHLREVTNAAFQEGEYAE